MGVEFANAPVASAIMLLTIVISLYGIYSNRSLVVRWMLRPYYLVRNRRWTTLLTSGFVHGDVMHLMFNMISFYFFAFIVEARIGSVEFLIMYLLCMVLADVKTIIKQSDNPLYASLGASGAVSGIIFSSIIYYPQATLMIFPIPVPIPSPIFAVLYLAYCFYAGRRAHDNINHDAHLWGAISGLVITAIISPWEFVEFFRYIFG